MKLSPRDKTILQYAQHRADASISEIASLTKIKESSVRYTLNRLQAENIIRKEVFINVYPLGYRYFTMRFGITSNDAQKYRQLLKALIDSSSVAYIRESGGYCPLNIELCARKVDEAQKFLDALNSQFGALISEKTIAVIIGWQQFPMKSFSGRNGVDGILTVGPNGNSLPIDGLDKQILSALATIGTKSYREVARSLGISASTLEYRLKRFKGAGVFLGTRYMINPTALELQTYLHFISAKGLNAGVRERFYAFARRHPNVYYLVNCLGQWDFEMGSVVEQQKDLAALTVEMQRELGEHIFRVETLPIYCHYKASTYPFGAKDGGLGFWSL